MNTRNCLFQFKENLENTIFLDKLKYNYSESVGSNPRIMIEPLSYPIHSELFNSEEKRSSAGAVFPPIRQPKRQVLIFLKYLFKKFFRTATYLSVINTLDAEEFQKSIKSLPEVMNKYQYLESSCHRFTAYL